MADYPLNDNFWPSFDAVLERYEDCDSTEAWLAILNDIKNLVSDEIQAVEAETD